MGVYCKTIRNLLCEGSILYSSDRSPNRSPLSATRLPCGQDTDAIPFLEALSTTLRDLDAKFLAYITTVRKSHNTLRPIHRLPPELFIEIIKGSVEEARARTLRLEELSSTCVHWHCSIISTPALWAVVSPHDPPEAIHKTIRRSQRTPLDIVLQGWENLPQGHRSLSSTVEPVFRCADRWRTAELRLLPCSEHMLDHLATSVSPFLEVLKVSINKWRNRDAVQRIALITPFGGQAERLRVLHLAGIGVPWDAPFMTQLHDLEIGNTYLTIFELSAIIRNNPSLTRLSIEGVIPPTTTDLSHPKPAFQHDSLKVIVFPSSTFSPAAHLLPWLRVPNCANLAVDLGEQPSAEPLSALSREVFQHAVQQISSSRLQLGRVVWEMSGGFFDFELSKLSDTYQINCCIPSRPDNGVAWMEAILGILDPILPITDFVFANTVWEEGPALDSNLVNLFGRLPRVKSIVHHCRISSDITDAMSRIVEVGGSSRWMYAGVETLVVDTFGGLKDLMPLSNMIKKRYGKDVVDTGPDSPSLPPRFKRIELPEWARGSEVAAELEATTELSIVYLNTNHPITASSLI